MCVSDFVGHGMFLSERYPSAVEKEHKQGSRDRREACGVASEGVLDRVCQILWIMARFKVEGVLELGSRSTSREAGIGAGVWRGIRWCLGSCVSDFVDHGRIISGKVISALAASQKASVYH